jgi:hypothetical protein
MRKLNHLPPPVVGVARPLPATEARQNLWLWVMVALLAALFCARARGGEEDPAKALDKTLESKRAAADLRSAAANALTPDQQKAVKDKMKSAQTAEQKKKDMAEYKEKTLDNLGAIKEMFAKAEESWKNQKFGEAGLLYNSVATATVPGAEQMVETSRGRMVEMEDLAKKHLESADDNDLKREYVKEVDELALVHKEFTLTKTHETAWRRLVTLKSRPEVAGYVEMAQAEALETDGKLMDAINLYKSIASNPRYENTIPGLKARRKLEELDKNEATAAKIKTEVDTKADKEAPVLLTNAKNFISNNMPKQAMEKLQQIVEKYPSAKCAEEAKKLLAELK